MEPLKLNVNPAAQFRMQPCGFVLDEILRPLKELLDQFVSEGVFGLGQFLRLCLTFGYRQ